jgi:hypothetical protein
MNGCWSHLQGEDAADFVAKKFTQPSQRTSERASTTRRLKRELQRGERECEFS